MFVDEWDVDAPQEQIFDILVDTRSYPEWWTPTYLSGESEGPPEPGSVSRVRFKSKLPFVFKATSRLVRVNRPHEFEANVEGDLRGVAVWTLTPRNGKSARSFRLARVRRSPAHPVSDSSLAALVSLESQDGDWSGSAKSGTIRAAASWTASGWSARSRKSALGPSGSYDLLPSSAIRTGRVPISSSSSL